MLKPFRDQAALNGQLEVETLDVVNERALIVGDPPAEHRQLWVAMRSGHSGWRRTHIATIRDTRPNQSLDFKSCDIGLFAIKHADGRVGSAYATIHIDHGSSDKPVDETRRNIGRVTPARHP